MIELKKFRAGLQVRTERVQRIFAGEGWKSESHETYTTRWEFLGGIDLKLVV